jgi:hypothetical protein
MAKLNAWCIIGYCSFLLDNFVDFLNGHEDELCFLVDESLYQPRARRSVNVHVFPSHPLQTAQPPMMLREQC